jgi:autotransporter-associated beta strand protein
MVAAPRIAAADLIWDPLMTGTGSDGSGTWTDVSAGGPANWSTGNADTTFNSNDPDSAIFGVGGTGAYNVTLGSPITVQNLTFNSGSYTIAGTGSNTLTLGSPYGPGGDYSTITTNVDATISAAIVDVNASETSGFYKLGSGTLTLTGANSYTGATNVEAGKLVIANRNVGTYYVPLQESAITVSAGATVDIKYSNYGYYTNGHVIINGDGTTTGHGLQLGPGVHFQLGEGLVLQNAPTVIDTDGSGPGVAYLGGFDVNNGDNITVASSASGSSSTANIDIDTYAYGFNFHTDIGANTATGDFTVNGSIVSQFGAGTGGNYNSIASTTDVYNGFTKTGAGSLVLTGASTFYAGTTVGNGSLVLQGGDNRLPTSTVLVVGDGLAADQGLLVLNGVNQTLTGLFFTPGSNASSGVVGGSSTATTLTVNSLATNPLITAPKDGNGNYVPLTNVADNYAGMLGGTGANQNNLNLVKAGPGTLTLSGSSTYTGTTNVSAGTLVLASAGAASTVSPTTVMAGAILDVQASNGGGYAGATTVINGDGTGTGHGLLLAPGVTLNTQYGLTLQAAPTTIDTDGTSGDGSGVATFRGFDVNRTFFLDVAPTASGSVATANINFSTATYGYNLEVDAGPATATGDFTIRGAIVGTGTNPTFGPLATGFNKVGAGSLLLSGTGTFAGGTAIANGSILLGGTNVLPTTTAVQLGDTAGDSGTLVLGGYSQTITGLTVSGTGTASAVIGGGSTASTLTVAYASGTDVYAGKIGGTAANANNLGLTVTGAGKLLLTGSNTYAGPTLVMAGTLAVNGSTGAASAVTVAAGAVLAGSGTVGGTVSVAGTITGGTGSTPADTVGTLSTGKQTWTATGTYLAKAASIGAGATSADELVVSALAASPGFTVSLLATNGSTPAFTASNAALTSSPAAGSFIVLVRDGESAATNPFASPSALAALGLRVTDGGVSTYAATDTVRLAQEVDGNGFDLIAEDVASAPEPTSLALLVGVAAPVLVGRRRRRA